MASCSISASPRSSSTTPREVSVSAPMVRSTCAWGTKARAPPSLVNRLSERELADILFEFGEERLSRRIARAIVAAREEAPIVTTARLAAIIRSVVPADRSGIDPATRSFQAIRIRVNDELGEIERALSQATQLLAPGGRLVVVSFHSLEDRIVKRFMNEAAGRAAGAFPPRPARARATRSRLASASSRRKPCARSRRKRRPIPVRAAPACVLSSACNKLRPPMKGPPDDPPPDLCLRAPRRRCGPLSLSVEASRTAARPRDREHRTHDASRARAYRRAASRVDVAQ